MDAPNGVDHVPSEKKADRRRLVVIGSGPIRIGQGIEFDYGAVHAVQAIREAGHEAILVNNNPETVSTDFDTSDRLYFDLSPLNASLKFSYAKVQMVFLQFGGQTAINLALPLDSRMEHLSEQGLTCSMLGTSPDAVDEASDRERFEAFGKRSIIRLPEGRTGKTPDSIRAAVAESGYLSWFVHRMFLGVGAWRF